MIKVHLHAGKHNMVGQKTRGFTKEQNNHDICKHLRKLSLST